MKIALDIGHADGTGARGNGLEEHSIADGITYNLEVILKQLGHSVTVIDYPEKSNKDDLNATIKEANKGNYDIGISIHCDCSDNPNAKGAHVCYLSTKGLELAREISEHLCELLPGRAEKTVKRANLAVLKQTKPVWVLVECGFISNEDDAAIMSLDPRLVAERIADGIHDYGCKNRKQ